MLRLLFLSLLITVAAFGQPVKASLDSFSVELKDSARYYYNYSPRFQTTIIDSKWDLWYTYVIDSTYFPGTERFPDGTYKRWKRAPDGKLLTRKVIAHKDLRAVFLADTATYAPDWRGEIPRGK